MINQNWYLSTTLNIIIINSFVLILFKVKNIAKHRKILIHLYLFQIFNSSSDFLCNFKIKLKIILSIHYIIHFTIIIKHHFSYYLKTMENNAATKCKIVLLGDQSVGKTSIINRFIFDNFTGNEQVTLSTCSQLSA